jgi:hypothetical protein
MAIGVKIALSRASEKCGNVAYHFHPRWLILPKFAVDIGTLVIGLVVVLAIWLVLRIHTVSPSSLNPMIQGPSAMQTVCGRRGVLGKRVTEHCLASFDEIFPREVILYLPA